MIKFSATMLTALLILISVSTVGLGDDVGVRDIPNTVGLGQKFQVQYLNFDKGEKVVVEFYLLLSQLLPYQYTADEYHGKRYGNISRLIAISCSLSTSWVVTPQRINLQNVGTRFNITVSLYYGGYWDMLLVFRHSNGTVNYMMHSLPRVVNKVDFESLIPWLVVYLGTVFTVNIIIVSVWQRLRIRKLSV
ncbi:MAG: hypothetical protein J7L63_03160 [Thermoplasmata archaeon]|nr:hypothetical protein [Thermoplasmata archaeon]